MISCSNCPNKFTPGKGGVLGPPAMARLLKASRGTASPGVICRIDEVLRAAGVIE